jgi:hypothetical protein
MRPRGINSSESWRAGTREVSHLRHPVALQRMCTMQNRPMDTPSTIAPTDALDRVLKTVRGKYVCCDCIHETSLKYLAHDHRTWPECNFCGVNRKNIAAPLEEVRPSLRAANWKRQRSRAD